MAFMCMPMVEFFFFGFPDTYDFNIKVQRNTVDAIPQARRLRPIGEYMPQMPVAAVAVNFGPARE